MRGKAVSQYPAAYQLRVYLFSTPRHAGRPSNSWQRISLMGFHPLQGSLRAAPIACDGLITLELWLDRSICPLRVMAAQGAALCS